MIKGISTCCGLALALLLAPMERLMAQGEMPHHLAPEELPLIRDYAASRAGAMRGISTPPPFPVRTMAEWEEVQSVVVTWTGFPGILKQIVRNAQLECEVIIVCTDQDQVLAYLQGPDYGGALSDLSNITFLESGFNSIWSRDYLAETIYANEVDSLFQLDWIYNRPRPADDELSAVVAESKGITLYNTTQAPYDLVHTGGNFMSDGAGTAFSSELVLEENGSGGNFNQTTRTEAGVDLMMQQFMGIEQGRYIKMSTLPFDGIHHIDMHMKLLDEERILVGAFPVGVSDGPQLESNINGVVSDHMNYFGEPYELIRIPMPPSQGGGFPPNASYRTYANNVFINRTLLVPTYRTEYDTTGLRILRESLPGYNVVGIDCDSDQNIIQQSGALHCITKTIGVADPLLIRHARLRDTYVTTESYIVNAYIRHRSGIASARLFWTLDPSTSFQEVAMADLGQGEWSGGIPPLPAGSTVHYYIEATSVSGKVQVRPLVAPEGWWRFRVLELNTGIQDPDRHVIINVYPNPTTSILVIELERGDRGNVRVHLADASGREVMLINTGPLPSDRRLFADLSALAEAPYLLVVQDAGGRSVLPVIKN